MFDAFSKADLPTVQALIQSKPDLVSLGGGGEGVKCLMLSARLIYPQYRP